jgi:hypothetical protein
LPPSIVIHTPKVSAFECFAFAASRISNGT